MTPCIRINFDGVLPLAAMASSMPNFLAKRTGLPPGEISDGAVATLVSVFGQSMLILPLMVFGIGTIIPPAPEGSSVRSADILPFRINNPGRYLLPCFCKATGTIDWGHGDRLASQICAQLRYSEKSLIFAFGQLQLHHGQLALKYSGGNYAYNNQGARKPTDVASPVRHPSFIDFMWATVFLVATALSVFISFKSTEYADNRRWLSPFWWVPALAFIGIAFWCAAHALASLDSRSENVGVEAVVVSELKLRDVQRQIFLADFVEAADDAALEDAPEAFNRVGVDRADNILPAAMVDGAVRVFRKPVINLVFVGRQQANLVGNDLADKTLCSLLIDVAEDAGDHVAFALHGTDYRGFVGHRPAALAQVFVAVIAADPSFIDLDNAAQFVFGIDQGSADFVAHGMGGFVGAETHCALHLQGANALFAGQHHMDDFEPITQGLVCVLEDGPRYMGEPITGPLDALTLVALPLEGHGADRKDLHIATARAIDAFGPAPGNQIAGTMLLVGKHRLKLAVGHLVDWLRTLGHDGSPYRLQKA